MSTPQGCQGSEDDVVVRSRVPGVGRAAAVMQALVGAGRPRSAAQLARATGLPGTTAAAVCEALLAARLLVRGADGSLWLGPQVAELASAARAARARRSRRLAVLVPTLDNRYYEAMLTGLDAELAEQGIELVVRSAGEDPDRQSRAWEEELGSGVDAVLLDAVAGPEHYQDLLGRSARAGVPVVAIGSTLPGAPASVTSDNVQAGLLAGRHLADLLPHAAVVGVADGLPKRANGDRVAGLRQALAERPDLVLVSARGGGDNPAAGRRAAEELLTSTPGVAAVFAICEPVAFGVLPVLEQRGRRLPVVSVDGRREAVELLGSGSGLVATAVQDPARIVRRAVQLADQLLDRPHHSPLVELVPVRLVDRDNAAGYRPW